MSETPNQAKPVTDTLDDLLNNPFSTCRHFDHHSTSGNQSAERTTNGTAFD